MSVQEATKSTAWNLGKIAAWDAASNFKPLDQTAAMGIVQ